MLDITDQLRRAALLTWSYSL